jgi:hypothetical protein
MIDLCTVVFRDEVDTLHTQARSIDRYVPDVSTIYVVVNDSLDVIDKIDTSNWGRYRYRVQIVHRDVFSRSWSDTGWLTQQVLKLSAAALSSSKHCVALDAKTIFVKPLPHVTKNSRLAVGILPVYEVFEASKQIVNSLWNIDLQRQLGPGGVPFWFDPCEVRAMISDIEQRVNQNFVTWFQEQGRLTEFLLYSGWMEYRYGIDSVTLPSEIFVCNLCHSDINKADQKLADMNSSHTVSVHRHAWSQLNSQQRKQFNNLLQERLH